MPSDERRRARKKAEKQARQFAASAALESLRDLIGAFLYTPVPNEPPPILWHYTSLESFRAIVESGVLRAIHYSSSKGDVNDVLYAQQVLQRVTQQLWTENEDVTELTYFVRNYQGKRLVDIGEVFLQCFFSEDDEDVGMWDRYGDQRRGCAIGFALRGQLPTAMWSRNVGIGANPVEYDVQKQETQIREDFQRIIWAARDFETRHPALSVRANKIAAATMLHAAAKYAVAFKDPGYRSEKEWRVTVTTIKNTTDIPIESYIRGSEAVRFVRFPLHGSPPYPITRVLLGPAATTTTDESEALLRRHGHAGATVHWSRYHRR